MELSPGMRNVEPYPFEELDRRKQEALDAGRALIDLGVGDPRDETPAFIRDAARAAIAPTSSYPRAAGLPELRDAIVAWADRRFGVTLDPSTDLIPTLGSKESIFSLAQAVLDPGSGQGPRARDRARIHDPGTRRAVRRGRGGAPAARSARLPARPRRDRRGHLGAGGHPVAQLPEQPDRRHGAACVPRARRRPGAPTRRPAGAGRGVQRAVVRRRTSGLGPADRRPDERRRAQHAEQALEHDGVPLGVHGRRRAVDRGDEGAPPFDGGDAAGVRPARVRRRLERRGPRAGAAAAIRRQARALPCGVPAAGCRGRGERGGHVSVGPRARRPPVPHVGARAPGARTGRRTGSFFGPEGEGFVRMAMVATLDDCTRAVEILESALSEREVHA